MKKSPLISVPSMLSFALASLMLASCAGAPTRAPQYQNPLPHQDPIVRAFIPLASSSVSDAVDKVVGQRGFMSHEIKPLFPVKLCGRAVTVRAQPSDKTEPPVMALELIDTSEPGKVLVIVMDGPDGRDVAAFGGIMCTGSVARGFAGAVLDGGCRDVREIQEMGFPVYSRSIVPTNSLGRYVNVAKNQPVICGGVEVSPGDILVGDRDGIAVVPQAYEQEVLKTAQDLEKRETATARDVIKLKSIRQASEKNKRI